MMSDSSSSRSQAISLSKAFAFQKAVGILIPIILVRLIDVTEYGQYRLFWLVAGSVMLIAPLGVPRSLMFFLPRSSQPEKRLYVYQVFLFLFLVASLAAVIVGPWNPILPEKVQEITDLKFIIPVFVFFWVLSCLLDVLPNADLNIKWQSYVIISLSVVRVIAVVGTALWTRDLTLVFFALIGFSILKVALLLIYSVKYHGWIPFKVNWNLLWGQLCYAVPFGLANIAFAFRRQAEMWVVASIFSTTTFAIFSIGSMQLPFVNVIRMSIGNVLLPKMSKLHGDGDVEKALELNQKGNLVACYLVFPIAAFCFAFADKIISILYTSNYLLATPIMQIYLIAMARNALEASSLLMLFSQGTFLLRINVIFLIISILVSIVAAKWLGPSGAAIGSVLSTFLIGFFNFKRAAKLVGLTLRKFQEWRTILSIAAIAILSAGFARFIVSLNLFPVSIVFIQILLGGVLFLGFYIGTTFALRLRWILEFVLKFKKDPISTKAT